jgi:hypothetical protein
MIRFILSSSISLGMVTLLNIDYLDHKVGRYLFMYCLASLFAFLFFGLVFFRKDRGLIREGCFTLLFCVVSLVIGYLAAVVWDKKALDVLFSWGIWLTSSPAALLLFLGWQVVALTLILSFISRKINMYRKRPANPH